MKIMRWAFVCALVLLAAVAHAAEDKRALLTGKWTATVEVEGTRIAGVSDFKSDGTVDEVVEITQGGQQTIVRVAGEWHLDGDTIVTRYTKSEAPEVIAVGETARDRITAIDATTLSIVDEDGIAVTLQRVK